MSTRTVTLIDSNGLPQATGAALTGNTSAAASTPVVIGTVKNLSRYDQYLFRLTATNALTGGTCDYVLQRLVDGPGGVTWDDYLYFGQQAAATAVDFLAVIDTEDDFYSYAANAANVSWSRHDLNTDGTLVLTAGQRRGGPPGQQLRLVSRTGALVSAAAAVTLTVTAYSQNP